MEPKRDEIEVRLDDGLQERWRSGALTREAALQMTAHWLRQSGRLARGEMRSRH